MNTNSTNTERPAQTGRAVPLKSQVIKLRRWRTIFPNGTHEGYGRWDHAYPKALAATHMARTVTEALNTITDEDGYAAALEFWEPVS